MKPLVRATTHTRGALPRSEEHTSELQSRFDLVCRLLLEKKTIPSSAPPWRSSRHLSLRSFGQEAYVLGVPVPPCLPGTGGSTHRPSQWPAPRHPSPSPRS